MLDGYDVGLLLLLAIALFILFDVVREVMK
jgi:hypothetical protein